MPPNLNLVVPDDEGDLVVTAREVQGVLVVVADEVRAGEAHHDVQSGQALLRVVVPAPGGLLVVVGSRTPRRRSRGRRCRPGAVADGVGLEAGGG